MKLWSIPPFSWFRRKKDKEKRKKKKILIWGCIFPVSLLAAGGTTVGVLAATGMFRSDEDPTPTDIADIFATGTYYQWSNSASSASTTDTQDSSKVGSSQIPWNEIVAPSEHAIRANLNEFLTRSNQTSTYQNVINDLSFGSWVLTTSVAPNFYVSRVSAIPAASAIYVGFFDIGLYWDSTHDLSTAISNHIVNFSSDSTTKTAGDVLSKLSDLNSSFRPNAVEIGYLDGSSNFTPYDNSTTMSQSTLSSLWQQFSVDSTTGYGYKLTLRARTDGYYNGSADVNIYLKLYRITFNANTLFGSTRQLNNNGGSDPFWTAPNLEQAVRAWKTYYGTSTNFNGGSTAFDNFYTNNTTNSTLTIVAGSLNLSYGDANQFYTSDGGTSTTFALNVKATTSLSDVFKSNDGSISIPTDTNTSKIVYIIPPKWSTTAEASASWVDTICLLKNRYSSSNWSNFNAADFTSMLISTGTSSNGTTGQSGTLTISPISGSLFYSGTVTIYWQTYDYTV